MKKSLLVAGALVALAGGGAANAAAVTDPAGDFLGTYTGLHDADLDVIAFSAFYDAANAEFDLSGTMAGPITQSGPGLYVIGVNTGAGTPGFGASLGLNGVLFNRVILLNRAGSAALAGGPNLTGSYSGATFNLSVPLARLASTGFTPENYGFNLWPRNGAAGVSAISDFAPDNATVNAVVPEPSAWALMILGFGALGGALRRRRTSIPVAASA